MFKQELTLFKGKHVLLLQGPVGSFFWRLAKDLESIGAIVSKINFNAGDWFFFPKNAVNYRGSLKDWPDFFQNFVRQRQIDIVLLFGDARPIHRPLQFICRELNITLGVFEEGYVRPNYVTFELCGVNGFSQLPKEPSFYLAQPMPIDTEKKHRQVGNTYWPMVRAGFLYFTVGALGKPFFRKYQHHRPLSLFEAWPWIKSAYRKVYYQKKEADLEQKILAKDAAPFFLVPLQVHNDAQILHHSDFNTVEDFIHTVIKSFADAAPGHKKLIFKHHPMDRGYKNYNKLISKLAKRYQLEDRIHYIHDQSLPKLLDAAEGVVMINSTVGLSAIWHNAPTKIMGSAIYDMPGLTYQDSLDSFWTFANQYKIDKTLHKHFRHYLITHTQINGSFYKPFKENRTLAGLMLTMPKRALSKSLAASLTASKVPGIQTTQQLNELNDLNEHVSLSK